MPRITPPVQKIAQRLHVTQDLSAEAAIVLQDKQAHYLRNVLRLEVGAHLALFNGRDGEWRAEIEAINKKQAVLRLLAHIRPQPAQNDIWLLVAPVKRERLDYLAQKATEMGAGRLLPVITARTQGGKAVKHEKLVANVIEAAEQCNILSVPDVETPRRLDELLHDWPTDRTLIFCDEEADNGAGLAALEAAKDKKLALLIGPEGGFDEAERTALSARDNLIRISLGPRILRTDTAVVAALALVQSRIGDWGDD